MLCNLIVFLMKKRIFIYTFLSFLLFYSCNNGSDVKIEDKWDPIKYPTHLLTLNNETNQSLYEKMTAGDLRKVIDEDKSILDTLRTMTYQQAIPYIVKYEKEKPIRELVDFKDQLKREIESLKDGFDGSEFRSSVQSIQIELAVFEAWKTLYKKSKKSNDKEIKELGETLKKEAIRIQKMEFPKLRKAYGEVADELMWENNIDVKTGNSKTHQNLTFIGGLFASNKNIKEMQTQINEITRLLRFKTVNYLWYKGQDDYTYYDLTSKKDSDF